MTERKDARVSDDQATCPWCSKVIDTTPINEKSTEVDCPKCGRAIRLVRGLSLTPSSVPNAPNLSPFPDSKTAEKERAEAEKRDREKKSKPGKLGGDF